MGAEDVDTERTEVKTYVPSYQKETWQDHADDLDMSQSEFVRTMVQAGRRDFEINPVDGQTPDADPRGNGLKTLLVEMVQTSGPMGWDEIEEQILDDVEAILTESTEFEYSPRSDQYTIAEDRK